MLDFAEATTSLRPRSDKVAWALKHTQRLDDPAFRTGSTETDRAFLNAALCKSYIHFIANRRCAQLGLAPILSEIG